jgi:hypothetical protein
MAKKTLTILEDDIDGCHGAESILFGLDGNHYEIDLCEENRAKLTELLTPFIEAGRKTSVFERIPAQRRSTASGLERAQLQAVRQWALAQGIEVGDRGRVARPVIAAYEAAQ